jgi:hypothetical protein
VGKKIVGLVSRLCDIAIFLLLFLSIFPVYPVTRHLPRLLRYVKHYDKSNVGAFFATKFSTGQGPTLIFIHG